MIQNAFDPTKYKWRSVKDDNETMYKVHHDYTVLGYDTSAGHFDMLVRWHADGGHCHRHRHIATTTILVLEGEQHLWDLYPDGSVSKPRIRRAGDYALSVGVETPHLERGGDHGGLVLFSSHTASDGVLYEILDANLNVVAPITIDMLAEDFEQNAH